MLKACIGLNCARQIDFIDRRHCNLALIPEDIYRHERTLEELMLDTNMLQELPPRLFRLTNLRKLTLSENDLQRIPPGVANFTKLLELDVSKNGLEDLPQNIQFCRALSHLNVSSNPLLRTPEIISAILSLTQLCINDTAIPRLPMEIGNLKNLTVLDARENMLKTLPASICQCKKLRKLDVGNNEIDILPEDLGQLEELTELWLDSNLLSHLPESLTNCTNLTALDVTKNRLEYLPEGFPKLKALSDLHLSENCLESLPENLGALTELTLLKLDLNHLIAIPESIGKLHKVTELLLFDNLLESIPASLFGMKSLEMLNLDRNHLLELPTTLGEGHNLHVLSLRDNELLELPEGVGQLRNLRVLDVSGNRLQNLPLPLLDLTLDALWIDGGQPQPLVALIPEPDPEDTDKRVLVCSFLPQQGPRNSSMENFLDDLSESSSSQVNGSTFQRTGSFGKGAKLGVAFDPALGPDPEADNGKSKLVRFPTPFRKDMKAMKAKRQKKSKYKPNAEPKTSIFRKGSSSQDDLTLLSVNAGSSEAVSHEKQKSIDSLGNFNEIVEQWSSSPPMIRGSHSNIEGKGLEDVPEEGLVMGSLTKTSGVHNLSSDELAANMDLVKDTPNGQAEATPDLIKNTHSPDTDLPSSSQLQTIDVSIVLSKVPGRSLGFSIAGGRGSTPAYEDVDESIFVTKIAPGGLAEQDGRLRLGDKLVQVNGIDMSSATHAEAVAALKSVTDSCTLVVSREVLVIMPEEPSPVAPPTGQGSELPPPPVLVLEDNNTAAKRIVSQVLDRSLKRYSAKLSGDGGQVTAESREGKPAPPAHDNYVNYDVTQFVLEKMNRKRTVSEGTQRSEGMSSLAVDDDRTDAMRRASLNMEQEEEEESYPEERVVLDRSIGKLGLSIVGGADHVSRVFGQGRPGVYISKISAEGAAQATGKLRLGDRILEVNSMSVRYSTHQQAVQWLIAQDGDIVLLVRHVPQPEGLQEVVLEKEPNEKLGISIRGGSKGSKGNPLDPEDEGIFISKVASGGAAERHTQLKVGQRILEVNGISLLGVSHVEAVKALRSNPERLYITVCDGYNPTEVLRRRSEALSDTRSESNTIDRSIVSLSAISANESVGLDIELRNMAILSASMDALTTSPKSDTSSELAVSPKRTYAKSSADIAKKESVTDEDMDKMLRELAEQKKEIEVADSAVTTRVPTPPPEDTVPLSEIVGTLQRGFSLSHEEYTDLPMVESDEPTGADEVFPEVGVVNTEDPNELLSALDSEVTLMQDEVTLTEENIEVDLEEQTKQKETPSPDKTPEKSPPKPRTSTTLAPPPKPVPMASPETRRRAEMIKVDLPNHRGSELAVQSIIGEVFSDVSFAEFEVNTRTSTPGGSSGIPTPGLRGSSASSRENLAGAHEEFKDLLSALTVLGTPETSKKTVNKESEAAAATELPPVTRDRSATNPTITVVTDDGQSNEVPLRKPSDSDQDTADRRKSAPPKVHEKNVRTFVNPEKLAFHERVAYHKRMMSGDPEQRPQSQSTSRSSLDSQPTST